LGEAIATVSKQFQVPNCINFIRSTGFLALRALKVSQRGNFDCHEKKINGVIVT
jgi:hypothetical protein